MVRKRGQGRSDRLLLVSPRAQSSLPPALSSTRRLPAGVHLATGDANTRVGTLGVDACVVVVFDEIFQAECPCQQTVRINCAGALDGKELFTIEGSEKWRSIPDDLEERENAASHGEKPIPPPYDCE